MALRVAAYGVCVEDGQVLLVGCAPPSAADVANWTLPGGRVEHGEGPIGAVVREFAEETGLDVAVERLLGVDSRTIPSAERSQPRARPPQPRHLLPDPGRWASPQLCPSQCGPLRHGQRRSLTRGKLGVHPEQEVEHSAPAPDPPIRGSPISYIMSETLDCVPAKLENGDQSPGPLAPKPFIGSSQLRV